MGNLQALSLAELVSEGTSLDSALAIHLRSNHYPPVHLAFVSVAKEAIALAEEDDWDAELTYPNGLVRTVAYTVEELHLGAFIDSQVEEY